MELMVVIAIIGILAAITIPVMAGYLRAATVRAGAQEMRTALQQAKQLAITRRQNICVQAVAVPFPGYQFQFGGVAIVLPGTDTAGTGTFRLQNTVTVGLISPGPPCFTPLGAAVPGGQFQVTGPAGNFLTITVSGAGRITTP
jgi:type II secretory pathway pseudopilin PulG